MTDRAAIDLTPSDLTPVDLTLVDLAAVGLDGCRGGWIAAAGDPGSGRVRLWRIASVAELFAGAVQPQAVAIDMPIGLPEWSGPRGRTPERDLRPRLGGRQSSVFSIPSRAAVHAAVDPAIAEEARYRHACAIARATSAEGKVIARQSFAIFPKIVALDLWLREHPELVPRVHECHPEASFWAMNDRMPVPLPKKVRGRPHPEGLDFRRGLLARFGFPETLVTAASARLLGAGEDDLIDACAALWTARRILRGEAESIPDPPERDGFGLPIAIRV